MRLQRSNLRCGHHHGNDSCLSVHYGWHHPPIDAILITSANNPPIMLPINSNAPYGVQTYRDLLIMIQAMSEDQLDSTPTVYDSDSDEYYPATTILTASDTHQVLDENHPYLTF